VYTLDTNAILYYLRRDPSAVEVIEDIFASRLLIPVDLPLAREAGRLRGLYGIDAGQRLATTALFTETQLITRNVRDFKHIPELARREI